jgi:D-alanyl-D-alanine endopeptidase (penicillin-binding protein 7)
MKKIWFRIAVVILVIWGVSAAFSALITSKPDPAISIEESSTKTFQLVKNENATNPLPKGIRAKSAIVVDLDSGTVIIGKNEDSVRSIASLTKLATALVFLNTSPDMQRIDTVTAGDRYGAGRSHVRIGSSASLYDFFNLMLICSDNVSARVIARSTGLDSAQFVARMNRLAKSLNLTQTNFADPTGLDPGNVSTASELAILFHAALERKQIAEVIGKKDYTFRAANGRRTYTLHNTNRMLGRLDVIGGKTGYIMESGYCLALRIDDGARKLAAVLLGAPTSGSRFRDAMRLLTSLKAPPRMAKQAGNL